MNKTTKKPAGTLPLVRCAIYTRKSTEEGLEQVLNSLDAEREAGEAFVASQRAEGWICLPDRYDDGCFRSGQPFTKTSMHRLLTNVVYAGKVRYKDEVHASEHMAILDTETFQRQALATFDPFLQG